MVRPVTCATLAACVLLTLIADAQQQRPLFRGTTESVPVFVTVTDKDGRLVTNLAREDFELRDEGKVQPISQFDNTPQPIRLIMMLDVSGSMEGNIPLLRAGASQLFPRLREDDEVRVGTFGREIVISEKFTRDPAELRAALPTEIIPDSPTPLWRAIDQAMTAFGETREKRSVILVLSDGKDAPAFSFKQRPMSQSEVIERARREDVMIFGVGLRSRRSPGPPMPVIGPAGLGAAMMADLPDPGLALVAEKTGGGYTEIRPNQDLGAAFSAIADELHSQYLLGFAPPKRDGKTHDIEVKVKKSGMKARARESYVAPKD